LDDEVLPTAVGVLPGVGALVAVRVGVAGTGVRVGVGVGVRVGVIVVVAVGDETLLVGVLVGAVVGVCCGVELAFIVPQSVSVLRQPATRSSSYTTRSLQAVDVGGAAVEANPSRTAHGARSTRFKQRPTTDVV
jgi:hypothetical protein